MISSRTTVIALTLFLLGCSGDNLPPTGRVSGTVTLGGKVLPGGIVTFHPKGEGNPGLGEIQKDGTFTLTTYKNGDGAVLGEHSVTVEIFPGQIEEAGGGLPGAPVKSYRIPKKYTDAKSTPLKFEVKSGSNTAELKLDAS